MRHKLLGVCFGICDSNLQLRNTNSNEAVFPGLTRVMSDTSELISKRETDAEA